MSDCGPTFENIAFSRKPNVIVGASWPGFTGRFESDGTEYVNDLDKLEIQWIDGDGNEGPLMTSAGGSPVILITDEVTWAYQFSTISPSPFDAGVWKGVLTATDSAGFIRKDLIIEQSSLAPF